MTYQALQIHKDDAGYRCTLQTLDDSALPEGDVTVQVDYSTLNYKDGLAITGKSPVVRKFPLTPGIDDAVMPAFSSGQWAGTVPATWAAVHTDDLLFMSGGGILAHPDGPAAGVQSIRQAWQAVRAGQDLAAFAAEAPELRRALAHFGSRA